MNFGTEFTELAATIGSKKESEKDDDVFLTRKQWVLVILASLALAGGIELWLRASGM